MHDYKRAMALIDTASNGRSRGVQAETDKFASGAYLGLVLFGLVFLLFGETGARLCWLIKVAEAVFCAQHIEAWVFMCKIAHCVRLCRKHPYDCD